MKNSIVCFIITLIFTLGACSSDDILEKNDIAPSAVTTSTFKDGFVCIDMEPKNKSGMTTYGALQTEYKWNTGQTITIKFLNGDSYLQEKVKQYANIWLEFANLKFEYVNPDEDANIRISFDGSNNYWSLLGTDCLQYDQSFATMNFGGFDQYTPENEFSRLILHEFGHALGLIHEHQSPASAIKWNKPAVYEYYMGPPTYWDAAKVESAIFDKLSETLTNYTSFDQYSIMLYSFPSEFTLDGWSSGWNEVLSYNDVQFIGEQYPF